MPEINIALNPDNFKLLSDYSNFGYNDRNEFVNSALNLLAKNFKRQDLESSAKLYLDEYENDTELQTLTESAINDLVE